MPAQTSRLHVRVNGQIKTKATDALARVGLTPSDVVRILLTRVATEGGLPTCFQLYMMTDNEHLKSRESVEREELPPFHCCSKD